MFGVTKPPASFLAATVVLQLFVLSQWTTPVRSEKILSIQYFSSRSHKIMYEPMLIELANRGHQVKVVNPAKSTRPPIKNYEEVQGVELKFSGNRFEMKRIFSKVENPFVFLTPRIQAECPTFFELEVIQEIMKEKYDLILMEPFMNECIFGLLHHFNTTFIFVHTFATPFWLTDAVGLATFPSITPLSFLGYTDQMNFVQRLHNSIVQTGVYLLIQFSYKPKMEEIYRKYIGESTPSIDQIARRVSLILENSHPSMNYPRPTVPEIVDVGGMHCTPANPLRKDLDEFIRASGKDGFIYFSLGSVVQPSQMPENYRKVFIRVFSQLKQNVLWKWDEEAMEGLPTNVKLSKWFPQQDILGQRKCRLFITHGGLLSTQEAVYHGVPILGLPLFGDQEWNVATAEQKGFGKKLDFADLTEETLLNAILELLNNSTYTSSVQALSQLFKDQPITPLARALFSVEYVLRHKGFPFRSPARELNSFQYFSVDVIAFLSLSFLVILTLTYCVLRCLCKRWAKRDSSPGNNPTGSKKQKQKKL